MKLVRVIGYSQETSKKNGVMMTDTFEANTLDAARLPKSTLAWNLYGVKSTTGPRRFDQPCCSDVKVLRQGNTHTKIRGRDLRAKAAKVHIEPKQDSGFFEYLGANNETRVSTNT